MNFIDNFIIKYFNILIHKISYLNEAMVVAAGNHLIKGGIIVAILWYLLFKKEESLSKSIEIKEKVILTVYACILAILAGRSLAILLPYRARPILSTDYDFAYHINKFSYLNTWSSFPSDHAVLFFSLATGIFFINKKLGIFSFAYVFIVVGLPRIFLGFHYPSDILAGGLVGILITWLVSKNKIILSLSNKTLILSKKFPGLFYAGLFLLTFQIATMFNASRAIAGSIIHLLKEILF